MYDISAASSINTSMNTFLLPKARSMVTGQTVKQQDLTGNRYTLQQRDLCQAQADLLAKKQSAVTGHAWTGFVEQYTPTTRSAV